MTGDKSTSAQVSPPVAITEAARSNDLFPIVGIGASAGGLEAFSHLLAALPVDTGMAYVLVQHLDPNHKSDLSSLLSKVAHMPVQEAAHNTVVNPNHIYVIPPNACMTIVKGILQLTPRENTSRPFLSIDHFLRSLAEDQKEYALGVVLSGTGTDGTHGLEEIKAAGGIAFVQNEASAKYTSMPLSAIQSGCVDFILPPKEIGKELTRIGRHPYIGRVQAKPDQEIAINEGHYRKIVDLLCATAAVDFTAYRDTTIKRRIMRRVALHGYKGMAEYINLLEHKPDEVKELYHDLLINVTSFFREPGTFEMLKTSVFPKLLEEKDSSSTIRVWVPGCSTGQEAYSLAMTLLEFLDGKAVRPRIQIFATDISDERALAKAREGLYPKNIETDVSLSGCSASLQKRKTETIASASRYERCVCSPSIMWPLIHPFRRWI
jgi:two-component system CheB/CheR fusion protein